MQSENFDKKIKDLLSQRPPGNDNPEWDKMEAMLDKHMPVEKKDRRRFFFVLLFLFLLTGGGAFFIWQTRDGDKNDITDIRSRTGKTETPGINKPATEANEKTSNTVHAEKEKNNITDEVNPDSKKSPVHNNSASSNDDPASPAFSITNPPVSKKQPGKKSNHPGVENLIAAEEPVNTPMENSEPNKKQKEDEKVIKTGADPVSTEKNDEPQKTIADNKIDGQKTETKEPQPITGKKPGSQKQKSKSSFVNNLFFSASAGPDFSMVGFNNAGKLEMAYGIGAGYIISNKFSLRAGFYSARKIYTAGPDDYYMPNNIAQYYPNLKNIDANCIVYEIPLILDYTVSSNKKGSWFVSGGVSSLIMKEETYDYYYKPTSSPAYVKYTRTIDNENKHYFTQLNLSGGYTMKINKSISLRGEPYIKIATHGVGHGKVNLNSGGVLFSVIIKPFAKK